MAVSYVTVEGIVAVENGGESGGSFGRCECDEVGPAFESSMEDCALDLAGPAAAFRAGWPGPLLPYSEFVRDAETRSPRSDAGRVLTLVRAADDPEGLYEEARRRAEASVEAHWSEIMKLAEELMEVEGLNREGIELVFDPTWPEFEAWLNEVRAENEAAPWTKGEGSYTDPWAEGESGCIEVV